MPIKNRATANAKVQTDPYVTTKNGKVQTDPYLETARSDKVQIEPTESHHHNDESSNKGESFEAIAKYVTAKCYCLVGKKDVPAWINDNEYLYQYHRPIMPCFQSCLKSIFKIHAETGNIWTHFVGLILFIIAITGFYCALSSGSISQNYYLVNNHTESYLNVIKTNILFWYPTYWHVPDNLRDKIQHMKHDYKQLHLIMSTEEHIVVASFFMSGIICLTFSTIYHTFLCYSQQTQKILGTLDYIGIVVLQLGSCGPPYYYGFKCSPNLQWFYLSFIYVLAGVFIYALLFLQFSRNGRSYAFLMYGIIIATPAIHFSYLFGVNKAVNILHMDLLLVMGILYILGMLTYTYKIPERFVPNYCNLWFQSHQIFHVMVVAALFVHLKSTYLILHERLTGSFDCPY